ncbi:MAG: glycosyltransferase [Alphaproteobacteria bacterium]|nr:glycosyltransferase [Alphaproteobacteria bacterium]
MKVLILAFGSRGDVQPYVALGAALRARGHAVTLATGKGFEAMIERHGLTPAPFSVDVRALIRSPEMQRALRSVSARIKVWRDSKDMLRRLLHEMWTAAREAEPDIIVYHIKAHSAPHIAEALQTVAVPSFQIPAVVPTGAFPTPLLPIPGLGRVGNRLSHKAMIWLMSVFSSATIKAWRRRDLGLVHAGPRDPFHGYAPDGRTVPRLHGYSRHLVPVTDEWGAQDRVTGYWHLEQGGGWEPPPALARFLDAGPPPVYVGFGSMPAEDSARMTQTVLEALNATGHRGILATGWGGLAEGAHPNSIHVLDAAPHDWLFPRCAALVHHGGAGTTHEGLRWGRPSVVCPVFGDQPFWGRRVLDLGAGPAPMPQKRLTAAALAEAIRTAERPAVVARAAEIGAAMRTEPGADGAASALEAMVREPGG